MFDHVVGFNVFNCPTLKLTEVCNCRSNVCPRRVEVDVNQSFDVILAAAEMQLGTGTISKLRNGGAKFRLDVLAAAEASFRERKIQRLASMPNPGDLWKLPGDRSCFAVRATIFT